MNKDTLIEAMRIIVKDMQEEGCSADGITSAVLVITLFIKKLEELEEKDENIRSI